MNAILLNGGIRDGRIRPCSRRPSPLRIPLRVVYLANKLVSDPNLTPIPLSELNDLLTAASRTFAIGIQALPEPLETEVRTAYLLLRVSDYLEDDPDLAVGTKVELLALWADVLSGNEALEEFLAALGPVTGSSPDAQVAARTRVVHDAFQALSPTARRVLSKHVVDTSRGMARWVERGPDFETVSDLDDYMHEVAGRVGYLLTELFADQLPEVHERRNPMMRLGREFGLGLQTVNVIRGLHEDHERGWVYVPRAVLSPPGKDPATALRGPGAVAALDMLCGKAADHLEAAIGYIEGIPEHAKGVRVFCMLPLFFAARTLALSRSNTDVFEHEVKMTRPEVLKVTARTHVKAGSNPWMRKYASRLLAGRRP